MIKYKLVVNVFISINKTPYSFLVFLQNWLENLLLIASNELLELDPITVMKMTVSSSFVIILTFQWYLCKSDIAIFAWMLTQNYANIPFKMLKDSPPHRVNNWNFIGLDHFNTFKKYTRKFLRNLSNVVLWLLANTIHMRKASFYLLAVFYVLINSAGFYAGFTAGLILSVL